MNIPSIKSIMHFPIYVLYYFTLFTYLVPLLLVRMIAFVLIHTYGEVIPFITFYVFSFDESILIRIIGKFYQTIAPSLALVPENNFAEIGLIREIIDLYKYRAQCMEKVKDEALRRRRNGFIDI